MPPVISPLPCDLTGSGETPKRKETARKILHAATPMSDSDQKYHLSGQEGTQKSDTRETAREAKAAPVTAAGRVHSHRTGSPGTPNCASPVFFLLTALRLVCLSLNEPTRPSPGFIEGSAKIMPDNSFQPTASGRLALWIFGSIGLAVVTAALVAGLWYFLRGRRDKRTPETPQNTTLQRPVWPKHSHLCRVALPFSASISRLNPRAHHNPCRARRAPRSDPRVKLRLQARRCLLSSTASTPKRPRAG